MFGQYNEMAWFLIGVFTYRFLSAILTYGHMTNFVTKINQQALLALSLVSADLSFGRELKYKQLHKAGLPPEELSVVREVDERTFHKWKNASIAHLLANFPRHYRFLLKYEDWNGAMAELDRIYKKDIKPVRR
jgi:hypothetical protein